MIREAVDERAEIIVARDFADRGCADRYAAEIPHERCQLVAMSMFE